VPSEQVLISENDIRSGRSAGVLVSANNLKNSWIMNNAVIGNRANGMSLVGATLGNEIVANTINENGATGVFLGMGSTGNEFNDNVVNDNGRNGISVASGAPGNSFMHNSMYRNGIVNPALFYDARDDSWPLNTWILNECERDFPAGMICGVG
jgi:hypothetical protein